MRFDSFAKTTEHYFHKLYSRYTLSFTLKLKKNKELFSEQMCYMGFFPCLLPFSGVFFQQQTESYRVKSKTILHFQILKFFQPFIFLLVLLSIFIYDDKTKYMIMT